ncbi:unnamed protein product, partial [marine sediment metagenome]
QFESDISLQENNVRKNSSFFSYTFICDMVMGYVTFC